MIAVELWVQDAYVFSTSPFCFSLKHTRCIKLRTRSTWHTVCKQPGCANVHIDLPFVCVSSCTRRHCRLTNEKTLRWRWRDDVTQSAAGDSQSPRYVLCSTDNISLTNAHQPRPNCLIHPAAAAHRLFPYVMTMSHNKSNHITSQSPGKVNIIVFGAEFYKPVSAAASSRRKTSNGKRGLP